MSFGKKLKTLRDRHHLEQKDMCKRLNVSQPVYSRYERVEKEVSENDGFVKRVAEEFDVTRKWLIAENDSTNIFESGSISTSANGLGQIENYYNLPKDFMDAYFKQQQHMLEIILKIIGGG